jgi:hypothetical protein
MDETGLSAGSGPEGRASGSAAGRTSGEVTPDEETFIASPELEAATVRGANPADVREVGDGQGNFSPAPADGHGHPDNEGEVDPDDVDAHPDLEAVEEELLTEEQLAGLPEIQEVLNNDALLQDDGDVFDSEDAEGLEIAPADQPQGGGS